MRSVTILGATGSIGRSTLDLIRRAPDRFSVTAVTAQSNVACLAEIARANRAGLAVIGDETLYSALVDALAGSGVEAAAGPAAVEAAAARDADWTMAAIVGSAGLRPTMAAVRRGGAVALANKESLVCAGDLLTAAARAHGATMLPVDSEHNAIYQCFDHAAPHRIARVILTASGGPFRQWSRAEMAVATPEQAVRHPNWSMGAKISVDSATLMNKGLELIEAYHLFPVEVDQLDVIVHPQSVIHSMVEYIDGSVLAQMGTPDMRTPIAYTLAWPERMETPCPRLDFATVGSLDFEPPDLERFPALSLARSALATGGTAPAILNAANEVAVASFLARRIGFLDIAAIVAETMRRLSSSRPESLDHIFAIDAEARVVAQSAMEAQAA